MNQDWPDRTLAQFFERQRDADQRAAPSFARLSEVAPARKVRAPRRMLATAITVIAVPALSISLLRFHSGDGAVRASAVQHAPAGELFSWQSPTDVLLGNYAEIPLASMPPLGASWTDALIPETSPLR